MEAMPGFGSVVCYLAKGERAGKRAEGVSEALSLESGSHCIILIEGIKTIDFILELK